MQWGQSLHNPLRPLIQARKEEYARYRQLQPPSFIGQAPPPPGQEAVDRFIGPSAAQASEQGTLKGIGASPGIATGRAWVAHTLEQALALQAGDILVCRSTDPTWTALFAIAGGLVTDFGGSLSHAAVVGTHVATQKIVFGQRIVVDGIKGIVIYGESN